MKRGAFGWLLVLAFLGIYGGRSAAMAMALADNMTVVIDNFTGVKIFPRTVFGSSSTGSMDYAAVPSNGTTKLYFKHDDYLSLFFAHNCSTDKSGHLMNCSSGDCPEGSCTGTSTPVATVVEFENDAVSLSLLNGYNFAMDIDFECNGCACRSISCAIPLSECPEELRMYDESGFLMACMAGTGLPYCQDYTAPSSDFPSSASTTCSFKNLIIKITVSSRK